MTTPRSTGSLIQGTDLSSPQDWRGPPCKSLLGPWSFSAIPCSSLTLLAWASLAGSNCDDALGLLLPGREEGRKASLDRAFKDNWCSGGGHLGLLQEHSSSSRATTPLPDLYSQLKHFTLAFLWPGRSTWVRV